MVFAILSDYRETGFWYENQETVFLFIEKRSVDMLVSFEKMEVCRWLEYLKKDGKVVIKKKAA